MKLIVLASLFSVCTIASAQMPPPIFGAQPPNPFIGSAAGILPAGLDGRGQVVVAKPLADPNIADAVHQSVGGEMPADLRSAMETLTLIGRTDTHALIGVPVQQQAQTGQVMPGQNIRTISVKNGGDFYLAGRRLVVTFDQNSTAVNFAAARAGGNTLWRIDIDTQRIFYPQSVQQNAAPVSAGTGIAVSGVQANSGVGSTGSNGASVGNPMPSFQPQGMQR